MGLALCGVLAAAGGLVAQQSSALVRDTTSAEAASGQGVHVVKAGDTLWDLADRYLGNPHDWKALFQANRSIITNPHWIYPSERLAIPARAAETSTPLGDVAPGPARDRQATSPPAKVAAPAKAAGPETPAAAKLATDSEIDRSRPAEATPDAGNTGGPPAAPARTRFYKGGASSQQETESRPPALPASPTSGPVSAMETRAAAWLQSQNATRRPVGRFLGVAGDRAAAVAGVPPAMPHPWDRVYVAYSGASRLTAGDTLMLVRPERRLGSWGRIMRPTALVRVLSVSDSTVLGQITRQYDVVGGGDLAFLPESAVVGATAVGSAAGGVDGRGQVLGFLDQKPLPAVSDLVFVNLGRAVGVAVGDELDVEASGGAGASQRPVAVLRVVRVTDRTATARVIALSEPALRAGLPVRRSTPRP
jgi:LysM domain